MKDLETTLGLKPGQIQDLMKRTGKNLDDFTKVVKNGELDSLLGIPEMNMKYLMRQTGKNADEITDWLKRNDIDLKDIKPKHVDDIIKGASGAVKNIDPSEIRFSQTSVNGSQEIIDSMKKNGWKGDPIDVVEMPDGKITTIDNTRVAAAREAGIDVKANVRKYSDPLPEDMIARFTTPKGTPKTWGEALELRIQKQKASFRNNNPMGSYDLEKMK